MRRERQMLGEQLDRADQSVKGASDYEAENGERTGVTGGAHEDASPGTRVTRKASQQGGPPRHDACGWCHDGATATKAAVQAGSSASRFSLFSPVHDHSLICSWLRRVHTPDYVRAASSASLPEEEQRKIGLPVTRSYADKSLAEVSATVLGTWLACRFGLACVVGGGNHHAKQAGGGKFCLFNDVSVGAALALSHGLAERILILDLDVHQGDGTAEIFANEPRVKTVSIHCSDNFPFPKAKSDIDIELPAGTTDETYLHILNQVLPAVLRSHRPTLVFYVAGVDVHERDKFGNFALTDGGLRKREEVVFQHCLQYNREIYGREQQAAPRGYSPQMAGLHSPAGGRYEASAKDAEDLRHFLAASGAGSWGGKASHLRHASSPGFCTDVNSTAKGRPEAALSSQEVHGGASPLGVCCVVAGGYDDDIEQTVRKHAVLFE
ncbi:hypothetical protein BESB_083950 [Besnoitia besnoiti]|uniref:Histone deacetylase domain-containing protein n=1 Tax=Besnoitia besnoiti TaxID=94643 RepID=A0A2A9MB88_BESBE|nr:hypothetical protein BESB_083950 [Besnoitia besnoiti]PFH33196.1 hypothetical protein BESB_083950 [Besnoitia besnoiti]